MDPEKAQRGAGSGRQREAVRDWGEMLKTVFAVSMWYFWSCAVLFTNRHLLTSGLTSPISLTLLHMVGSSLFANGAVTLAGYEKQVLQSRSQTIRVLLLSATFGTSVVCGTAGLKFIPVSFNEMISSTTPLFAALFTFISMGQGQGYLKTFSLVLIAIGCTMASKGEPMWSTIGFLLSMTATATRALRTVLGEVLMSNAEEKLNGMNLLRYMSTFVIIMLIPVVYIIEGPDQLVNVVLGKIASGDTNFLFWFAVNITSAFSVNLCQLLVTKYVGSVAQQVLGICKGVSSALLSIMIFKNPVTSTSALGYATTVAGMAYYSYLRHQDSKKKTSDHYSGNDEKKPFLLKASRETYEVTRRTSGSFHDASVLNTQK